MKVVSPESGLNRSPADYCSRPADYCSRPADYCSRPAAGFAPPRIVLAKGSNTSAPRRRLAGAICAAYPGAEVIEAFDTAHNRVRLASAAPLERHGEGKQTLVLAEHRSAVRQSTEDGNTCPNYWHFSSRTHRRWRPAFGPWRPVPRGATPCARS